MKALIFAAGLGTRLRPLTLERPKALVEINGVSLLEYAIRRLITAGITDITLNVHHFAPRIVDFIRRNNSFGIAIHFSDESDLLRDTGGGIRHAAPYLMGNDPFLVYNVDILSNIDIPALYAHHQASGNLATLVATPRETSRYLLFDSLGRLSGWYNRSTGEVKTPYSHLVLSEMTPLAFAGIHLISPRIFSLMQDCPDVFSIIDFYLKNADLEVIGAYTPSEFRLVDVGKLDSIVLAEKFVAECN